uniref:Putative transcripton factor n=1 Tax=Paulinella micropora TaxID=1928728 RepID=A0A385HZD9_9EUKA|nr:putative transcripton factor [Paulinella micropora]AXY63023.1 putative transcripton factor [Paulinella micropora]
MIHLRIAIAGDLHGQWGTPDIKLLSLLNPDALLVVGDFSEGDTNISTQLTQLNIPVACILGNHDTGRDDSGCKIRRHLNILGDLHCGWSLRQWDTPISVVGARPGSTGGGFHLSNAIKSTYGNLSLEQSVELISVAASEAPNDQPLIILSHCGPSGLGSSADDLCGRDWKLPALDWGDQDLELALNRIRKQRHISLVVFGHMHHQLKRGGGWRKTHILDRWGTSYLNAASVPRYCIDEYGQPLNHFAWAEFYNGRLWSLSHHWYDLNGQLQYKQPLLRPAPMATVSDFPLISC